MSSSLRLAEAYRNVLAQLHPRWADAEPSLTRNGLGGFLDPDGDGLVHLETGHRLFLATAEHHPDWKLHITHASDGEMPARKAVVPLGPGDHDVGDRVIKALRHPKVMGEMRELMTRPDPDEWWYHEVRL